MMEPYQAEKQNKQTRLIRSACHPLMLLICTIGFTNPLNAEPNTTNQETSTQKTLNEDTITTYLEHPPLDCLIEPHQVISIGTPSTGIIGKMPVERGDVVAEGAVLAQLDNSLEQNAIKVAEERRDFLNQQYQRTLELSKQSMITHEAFQQSITELSIAELELKRRQIQYQQKQVKSPVKGVVLERMLAPGEYAYEQTPLLKIAQTDPLNVEVIAPISLYNQLAVEQEAEIVILEPVNNRFIAKIEVLDTIFDTASGTFGIQLTLPNKDLTLPAGLECQVRFIANR